MADEQWAANEAITERAVTVLARERGVRRVCLGGIDHEIFGTGDERGDWFWLIILSRWGLQKFFHGFHSELIGVQFPRVIEVGVVAD